MGIDNDTVPHFLWVEINDTSECLKVLRDRAKSETDGRKSLLVYGDDFVFDSVECYFEDGDLNISFISSNWNEKAEGKGVSLSMGVKLSDTILTDIFSHAMKRLAKLRSAMESLK